MNLRSFFALLFASLFGQQLLAQCVFISEYIEGSANNKCIEIYNGTGAPLDLAAGGYALEIYNNGNTGPPNATIALSGIVPAGGVFVACDDDADAGFLAVTDQQVANLAFNGDDAIALVVGGVTLDVVGQIGIDPGNEWTGGCGGTQDQTLLRNPALGCPSFDGSTDFVPQLTAEWTCLPIDDFSDLGSFLASGCAIGSVTLTQTSCANGSVTIELDATTSGTVSPNFNLTVTPDPGGISGLYPYASLPLTLANFDGNLGTAYNFTLSDASGTCADATLTGRTFDCPVADALEFRFVPGGCVGVNEVFLVEVCAVKTATGEVQPDFSDVLNLAPATGATGTLSGSSSTFANNGCGTFAVAYSAIETFQLDVTTPAGLTGATSGNIDIQAGCPGITMTAGMVEPCGAEEKNEYIAGVTRGTAIDVGDIVVASVNHTTVPQPNPNHTWSGSGNDNLGSGEVCGNIGLNCYRWLDVTDGADGLIINNLINQLNIQANCGAPLFLAPLPGVNLGTIPANSRFMFFLGAGGNPSQGVLPGFDGLGTNLDFSGYCGQGPIYALFGEVSGTALGFFANGAPRTFWISVAGTQYVNTPYPTPVGAEPHIVDYTGTLVSGGDCTPPNLFEGVVLEGSGGPLPPPLPFPSDLGLRLQEQPVQQQARWELQAPVAGRGTLELLDMQGRKVWQEGLVWEKGTHTYTWNLTALPAGLYVWRLRQAGTPLQGRLLKAE